MTNKTNNSDKYVKMTHKEHILEVPDTYVGSIENTEEEMFIYDESTNSIDKKLIKYIPALYKLFDETLVNARDASINDSSCNQINIIFDNENGFISVFNNGDNGIPVEKHKEYDCMIPSLIFGELLTSSNYNKNIERTTGGKNGYGAKLVNIFSKKFIVEINDYNNRRHFIQEWTNNMTETNGPVIIKSKNKSSVKITFYPDFERFKIDGFTCDYKKLFYRRSIDIAGITDSKLKLTFNEKKIDINKFNNYVKLYYSDINNNKNLFFHNTDRWSVAVLYKQNSNNEVISFVNGINTYHGGKHCDHVINSIITKLINNYIKKKDKDLKVTPSLIRDNLVFFINSIIINPSFSSQTKDTLTTVVEKFGSKYEPSSQFLESIFKCGIVEQVIEFSKIKDNANLKKTDGKKQQKIIGIPKLDDANNAGTKESYKCTLILTEGDSAKSTAMAALSSVKNRNNFGVFPLRGKLLNVREATVSQLLNNEEIKNLKTIIGLKHGENYDSEEKFKSLRYGMILLFTDSDHDGSHITGLFINFIHSQWPSLIKRHGFIQTYNTPIVKVFHNNKMLKEFYNQSEYEIWQEQNLNKSYRIKYYKGLGTSTSQEAREYFIDYETKVVNFSWEKQDKQITKDDDLNEIENEEQSLDDNEETNNDIYIPEQDDDDAIRLAFDKKRISDRKKWLMNYEPNKVITYDQKVVLFWEFILYVLIHYANANIIRCIPSVVDGFKPCQRKIMYGCVEKGLDKDEVKVSQLAGFVSDKAAYHHGEMSLTGAIINMAQNYVGSNNINLLEPNGQFGSRLNSGKDHASSRYIWTKLSSMACIIFNSEDTPLYNYLLDDGIKVEPEFYVPIIPMVLINGIEGIGTGFSTKIPPYNPIDVIDNLVNIINDLEFKEMTPWWQSFKGTVHKINDTAFEVKGLWKIESNKLIIYELPVGESTTNYKEFLEKMLLDTPKKETEKSKAKAKAKPKKENSFLGYIDNNTDTKVYFELTFEEDYLENIDIEKTFKLSKKISLNNMHLYCNKGHIKKYFSIEEIFMEYYLLRLEFYEKRKEYQLKILEYQLKLISNKVKFILMVINQELIINNKKKSIIENELEDLNFPKFSKSSNNNIFIKDNLESENNKSEGNYDYLLSMPLYNLTFEKIEELRKQMNDKETSYNDLLKLKPKDIWLKELYHLKEKYITWYENMLSINSIEIDKKIKDKKIKKSKI